MTWQRDLAAAIALHDLATAGHVLVPSDQRIEAARVGVVAAIDRAVAAGVPEADIDAALTDDVVKAALGPCPPEPAPEPFRSANRTLVWTSGGELHIPPQVLTPDEAEAMADALCAHARYAREQGAASDA